MNKEAFVEILRKKRLTHEDMSQLDQLIVEYPWFGLPGFLKLKAARQLNIALDDKKINQYALFSSDRKFLYSWLQGEQDELSDSSLLNKRELEFFDDEEYVIQEEERSEDAFELMDDSEKIEGVDVRAILENEESDMEEPETEESVPLPVIDLEDEDEDEEDYIEKEQVNVAATSQTSGEKEVMPPREPISQEELLTRSSGKISSSKSNHSAGLIEQFLQSEPGVIKADKQTSLEGDVSVGSAMEDDSFITDTLAKIYIKQGLHAKAIYAYERLSLKYPEKSAYFAAQIEKIKSI